MALTFCPNDGTLLQLDHGIGGTQLWCAACMYKYDVKRKITLKNPKDLKEVDDVLGKEEMWKNAATTEAKCPHCEHTEANFQEIQTRSADEPASIFYRCTKCESRWREG